QNGHLAVVRVACFDRLERQSRQNSTNRPATAVGLWHTRRDANILVSIFREESGRHPFTVFLSHGINDIEIVIDFGRAEIQSRSLLAPDGLLPFKFRSS